MELTSFLFWGVFLPFVFLIYSILPTKFQNIFLLLTSLFFYGCLSPTYIPFLLYSILVTYWGGKTGYSLLLKKKFKEAKATILFAFFLNVLSLLVFKYTNFILTSANRILSIWNFQFIPPKLILPIGLSFFVFQSSTYLFDIYNNKIEAVPNFIDYALFVSFFPTITSGPIQRSHLFLPQIQKQRTVTWARFQNFFLLFLWGAFLKVVIANRIAIFTNTVFTDYYDYGFFMILLATLSYSVQIYADFSGYSLMAIAIAHLFGFDLNPNFARPYAATNIADFWRRWHISLSSWFRDYLYIPLGGNRKGTLRKYINLLIVFLISGLWHGASWTFVIWGALHGIYQIIGNCTKNLRSSLCSKMGLNRNCFSYHLWQRVFVYLIVSFTWLFFRAESCSSVFKVLHTMFTVWDLDAIISGHFISLGLNFITMTSILLLLVISTLRECGLNTHFFFMQNLPMRWICYFFLIIWILLFGAYGPSFSASSFIYAGF